MVMSEDEIRNTIALLAQQHAGWKGPLPQGDLGQWLDSVQRLSLVVAIEDRFHVRLDGVEDDLRTLDDLVRMLRETTHA